MIIPTILSLVLIKPQLQLKTTSDSGDIYVFIYLKHGLKGEGGYVIASSDADNSDNDFDILNGADHELSHKSSDGFSDH
jgi:hypothetical protein